MKNSQKNNICNHQKYGAHEVGCPAKKKIHSARKHKNVQRERDKWGDRLP